MTRKEEIKQAAHLYSPDNAHNTADTWEYACEWADKTMIDKACEWLVNNLYNEQYLFRDDEGTWVDVNDLIEDLKKTMLQ